MSGRFENIAIGFLMAGTFVICICIAHIVGGEQDKPQYAGRSRADQELASSGETTKNRRPAADRSICQQANTEKEYDLCQAWRSADATRDAANTAWLQYLASVGGLIGLFFTVLFTARAADGARKAAEVAERALVDLERPHVFVEITNTGLTQGRLGEIFPSGKFEFRFVNYGRTPALLTELKERYDLVPGNPERDFPQPIDPKDDPGRALPVGVVVAPDQDNEPFATKLMTVTEVARLMRNTENLFFSATCGMKTFSVTITSLGFAPCTTEKPTASF